MATALHAEGLSSTPCPTDTLANYISHYQSSTVGQPDGPCALGVLNFSGFSFLSFFGNSPSSMLGSSGFDLTPISPTQNGNTGFTISPVNPPFSLISGNATYVIDWYFSIDAGPIASGASLGMDPTGDVAVTADYCLDSYMTAFIPGQPSSCYGGSGGASPALQSLTVTPADTQGSIVFPTPGYEFADVRTIISLNSDAGPAVFDSASSDSNIAPEPTTWLLAPGGVLLYSLLRKRLAHFG